MQNLTIRSAKANVQPGRSLFIYIPVSNFTLQISQFYHRQQASIRKSYKPIAASQRSGWRRAQARAEARAGSGAATGSFGNAFYITAETQLDEVLKLIEEVDDNQYLAKLALYARERAFMKDMPAALLVALSTTVSFYTQFSI